MSSSKMWSPGGGWALIHGGWEMHVRDVCTHKGRCRCEGRGRDHSEAAAARGPGTAERHRGLDRSSPQSLQKWLDPETP